MSAKILNFPSDITEASRAQLRAELEYEERVALSSEVRTLEPDEFERILREHEEACIRQAVLKQLDPEYTD